MSQLTVGIHPKLNRLFADQDEKKRMLERAARGWRRAEMTLDKLAAYLDTGASVGAEFTDGHRGTDSARAQLIPIDIDHGNPDRQRIETILDTLDCAYVSGETGRSAPNARRYRFIIPLAEQVADPDVYRQLVERVNHLLRVADLDIDDNNLKIGQSWFGHKRGTTRVKQGAFITLAAIMALPAPPAPEKPVFQPRELPTVAVGVIVNWDQERSLWIAQEVMPALDRVAPVQGGQGKYQVRHCPNPNHLDKNPSFRVSYDKSADGIGQCSCGPHSMKEIAEWVNARDFKTWFKDERAALYPPLRTSPALRVVKQDVQHQTAPETYQDGQQVAELPAREPLYFFPLTVRRGVVMINGTGNVGLFVECVVLRAIKEKRINRASFTFDEFAAAARDYGIKLSPSTVSRAFNEAKKVFLSFSDIGMVDDSMSQNDINSHRTAGRPAQRWKLNDFQTVKTLLAQEIAKKVYEDKFNPASGLIPPLDVLKTALIDLDLPHDVDALNTLQLAIAQIGESDKTAARKVIADAFAAQLARSLDDTRGEPIPADYPMQTGADYLAAHGALQIKAKYQGDVHLSQQQIADDLGVNSRKVAARIIQRIGMPVTKRSEKQEITLTAGRRIYEQVESVRSKVKGKALTLTAIRGDGTVIQEKYSIAAAQRHMNEGSAVKVTIRTSNLYSVTPDVRPLEAAPRVVKPVQQQDQPTAPRMVKPAHVATAPIIERDDPDHIGFSRVWLREHLVNVLTRLNWIYRGEHGDYYHNPDIGELVPMDAPTADLFGVLIGRSAEKQDLTGALVAFAVEEFGAVSAAL